jgi:phage terminase large subunit-like protein
MPVSSDPALCIGDPAAWRRHKLAVLKGKVCFGGLDLGVVNDFTCLALYFPKQRGVPVPVLLLWAWVPENVDCHTILKERYGYHDWVAGECLKLTSGERTDYSVVEADILELDRTYSIQELACDPAYSFDLVQRLIAAGVNIFEHRQGSYSMTGPIKEFQRQIIGCDFVHGMSPLLTFMVDNLVVVSDGKGNLSCVKPGNPSSPRKIDGAVASIMAVGRSAMNPNAAGESMKILFI